MSSRTDYRIILLRCFRSGFNPIEAHQQVVSLMGPESPFTATVYRWFDRFAKADFSLDDAIRSGRPQSRSTTVIFASVQANPAKSVRDIERETDTSKSTVSDILTRSGLVAKRPHTVPHDLTAAELCTRLKVCSSLLSLYRTTAWIETIVVMDEKWITYSNPDRKL
ncbi:unnamed protein product [Heligmosomoides polygyrus]|uniref:HTH_48 domain-containing protein n=1 Tax=Heligmosomoides polygyrus TaxID=6339 RepID=A0A183FSB5_HELPZ|nr:unnamed protein product [Heligmosomoides polygyrus]